MVRYKKASQRCLSHVFVMYATADCEVDKKLKKRRMLNRAAAARCRQKKLDQIEDLKHVS